MKMKTSIRKVRLNCSYKNEENQKSQFIMFSITFWNQNLRPSNLDKHFINRPIFKPLCSRQDIFNDEICNF